MNSVQAVIFDFGGVLIDWSPYYLYRKILPNDTEIARLLQDIHFSEWNHSFDEGYPFEMGIAEMCRRYPERADLIRTFDERWVETLGVTFDANIKMIQEIQAAGYPVYGLSNWNADKFALTRSLHPFFDRLNGMVISGIEKVAKPDPRLYRILLERYDLDPHRCIYTDDVQKNVDAARSVGLNTILFRSSADLRHELQDAGVL
jgi:2-haloacid dehalogenase